MSRTVKCFFALGFSFPRVSGDEPRFKEGMRFPVLFSPRERG